MNCTKMMLSKRSQRWKNTHQVTPFISSSKLGKKKKKKNLELGLPQRSIG